MSVPRKRKETVWKRDNYICAYCHANLKKYRDFTCNQFITVDHVIEIHNGGSSKQNNLVTCCRECNLKKAIKNYSRIY